MRLCFHQPNNFTKVAKALSVNQSPIVLLDAMVSLLKKPPVNHRKISTFIITTKHTQITLEKLSSQWIS